MLTVYRYKDILLSEFHLDGDGNIRRTNNGYLGRFKAGDLVSFYQNADGYLLVRVPQGIRRSVFKHHLLLLLNGIEIPEGMEVDHIDGDKHNCALSNLRIVDRERNSKNRKKRTDNTTGYTGITWSPSKQRYIIRRTVDGVRLSYSRKTLDEVIVVLTELTKLDAAYTERHGL